MNISSVASDWIFQIMRHQESRLRETFHLLGANKPEDVNPKDWTLEYLYHDYTNSKYTLFLVDNNSKMKYDVCTIQLFNPYIGDYV